MDVKVPLAIPFDFATIEIRKDVEGDLSLALKIYFCSVLEAYDTPDEINRVYDTNMTHWLPALQSHFEDLASRYGLAWDIENDVCIEDSLHGSLPIQEAKRLIDCVHEIYSGL